MLQFLSHTKEDTVWERTLRAKFLNVEAWFPYINHNSITIQGHVSYSSWSRYTQCIVTQCLNQASPCLSQYIIVYCDTTLSHSSPSVTIQNLYRDTASQHTNLQYTSPNLPHIAIQFPAHCTSKGHVTIQFSIVS